MDSSSFQSQSLSLWAHHLVLAVLSKIVGNLSLILAPCGKFKYLKRVGTRFLRSLHSESLRVFHVADYFPRLITFSLVGG